MCFYHKANDMHWQIIQIKLLFWHNKRVVILLQNKETKMKTEIKAEESILPSMADIDKMMAKFKAERLAKFDPNAIVNNLLDEKKNVIYEGVSMGGRTDPANNWHFENSYLLMDMSTHFNNDYSFSLKERIVNEIVKPINEYLFEKTGLHYVHKEQPNYKGFADVPSVYNDLFEKVIGEIEYGFEWDFDDFAKEYVEEHKEYIDECIEKKEILTKEGDK